MREKTQKNLFDNVMWYLIYLLPIVIWLAVSFRTGNLVNLSSAMSTMGLEIFSNNQIYSVLLSAFGSLGVLPLFATTDILMYMAYFISVFLIHLGVDFILFIPRLAHKWLNKLYGGDN